MIEVQLYGSLRRYGDSTRSDQESTRFVEITEAEITLAQLLEQLGIPALEVSQVFLNGALLETCCSMAPWLGYQTICRGCDDFLDTPLRDGDRLGLFPLKMAMLVV